MAKSPTRLIVGISGGDFPTRGFLDAYDPQTGKRIWRFYTVPGPGESGSDTWPGADVMARNKAGAAPLKLAAENGHEPVAALLRRLMK